MTDDGQLVRLQAIRQRMLKREFRSMRISPQILEKRMVQITHGLTPKDIRSPCALKNGILCYE